MKTTNTRKPPKLLILAVILVPVLLVLGGGLLVRNQKNDEAIAKERVQYVQAEEDLEQLKARIVAKFGRPDDAKQLKSCGYTSDTFELAPQGSLYCEVEEYLYYGASNLATASLMAHDVADAINKGEIQLQNQTVGSNSQPPTELGGTSFTLSQLNCFANYGYHLASEDLSQTGYPKLRMVSQQQGLLIQLNCSSEQPKAEYYPVKSS